MFQDKDEELRRLEALLQEEEDDEQLLSEEEEAVETDRLPSFEDPEEENDDLDRFYANCANSYRAYNSDTTDTDLDEFSEDVWKGKRRNISPLLAVACILATAVLLVVLYLLARYGGWL